MVLVGCLFLWAVRMANEAGDRESLLRGTGWQNIFFVSFEVSRCVSCDPLTLEMCQFFGSRALDRGQPARASCLRRWTSLSVVTGSLCSSIRLTFLLVSYLKPTSWK